ncbi:AAA family ATPase [Lactiplantibacillus fabifermentans]|uniref:Nuclease SbcCD subunit C n=2 Tax=Lactiplantibacillus fabifermentans TaxID=483011 RepID=A0A0R2NTN5_9LACO|nr:SMC family ATPase [Lactiplantibacillus fabifermentans]ETY72973.1 hypothetical protein LFAB_14970 [Lactiplantibacillus fabifermentans T30PCM01]KRO27299.1 exonuclease SbcC [Lactiplantibacillus fabifermentans DSM 21115]
MRPLTLKLDFFGPFRQQTIDFTQFNDFPVFLISGKTGAGKTTIFDAMCFALFGGTSGSDRQVKQMRSDFATLDDITEVTFTFEHLGRTYRIVRSPDQIVNKKRGEGTTNRVASVVLTVFDEAGEEVEEYIKVNAVQAQIRDLLQLTKEQFVQIVLLPQGQFRKFLMANSDDKEKVLRDIFGTGLFGLWAQKLRDRLKDQETANAVATQTLTTYQQQLTWTTAYTAEELAAMAPQAAVDAQLIEQAAQASDLAQLKVTFDRTKATLEKARQTQQAGQTLQANYDAFTQYQQQLTELQGQQATIDAKKAQIKTLEWAQALAATANQLKSAQNQVAVESDRQTQLLNKQVELQQQQAAVQTTVNQLQAEEPAAQTRVRQITTLTTQQAVYEQIDQTQMALKSAVAAETQAKQQADELATQLTSLTQQQSEQAERGAVLPSLLTAQTDLAQRGHELQNLQQQYQAYTRQQAVVSQAKIAVQARQQAVTDQSELANKQRVAYEELDSQWASEQIAILSQRLLPEQPCPVCGSIEHPNPAPVDTITVAEEEVKAAQTASEHAGQQLSAAKTKLDNEQAKLVTAQAQLTELEQALLADLKTSLAVSVTANELAETLAENQRRLAAEQETNQAAIKVAENAQANSVALKDKLTALAAQQATYTEAVTTATNQVLQLKTRLADQEKQRSNEYETLSALKAHIATLSEQQTAYETAVKRADAQLAQIKENASAVAAQLITTKQHLDDAQATVTTTNAALTDAMTAQWGQADFDQLSGLLAQLSTLPTLRQATQNFDQQLSQLTGQLSTLKQQIKAQPAPDLDALAAKVTAAQTAEQIAEKAYYDLQQRLQSNETIVKKMQKTLAAVRDQQAQLAEMAQLSNVANGKGPQKLSLERFVLQTYLQRVLKVGNQRLAQLTRNRYQFRLDDSQGTSRNMSGLEINIYDDNAGKVRSVHTLSGGESFVAALSLALALATVIQEQAGGIKIDALFIDEGFGSLDEDALEMAMETLQQVEGQSRMIGIISHVRELESQLPAQLQVIPDGNGESHVKYQLAFT